MEYSRRCSASKNIGLNPIALFYNFTDIIKSKKQKKQIH
jgi:hypothetical protein